MEERTVELRMIKFHQAENWRRPVQASHTAGAKVQRLKTQGYSCVAGQMVCVGGLWEIRLETCFFHGME